MKKRKTNSKVSSWIPERGRQLIRLIPPHALRTRMIVTLLMMNHFKHEKKFHYNRWMMYNISNDCTPLAGMFPFPDKYIYGLIKLSEALEKLEARS